MLPLVLAISFLSPLGACADLSGRYVHSGQDNVVYVSIVQTRCQRIVMTWTWSDSSTPSVPFRIVLDGRFHSTSDGFAGFREMAASLNGPTLKILMKGQSPGDGAKPYTLRLTLLADGDLCVTDGTGTDPYSRYSRQRGKNEDARNADRSDQPCSVP